ncbi:MAG: kynureninase [Actinomycetota bacterium]|nr:kynureninase [Actinomycetota bacterium]
MTITKNDVLALDAADPLASFRERFVIGDDLIAYLDGNSLGRLPKATAARLRDVIDHEWGGRLIRGWEEKWVDLPTSVGDLLGRELLGAAAGQTVIADSTSVNIYKILHAAAGVRPDRTEIVVCDTDFPTDRYIVESVAAARGLTVRWISPDLVENVTPELLDTVLGPNTALVILSQVDYRSGTLLDMPGLTAQIQASGAVAVWDVCHSVGVLPIELDAAGVDFAVGCTYKYVNAGPGAPAFMYVAERHLSDVRQPITGWWSAGDMFAMAGEYAPAPSIRKMLSGTANVLGIVAVEEGVKLIAEAGIDAIRAKSIALTDLEISLVDQWNDSSADSLVTPRDSALRGGHVTVRTPHARSIADHLIANGIIPDFRNPDMIRLGLSPLTTSFSEVWVAFETARTFGYPSV